MHTLLQIARLLTEKEIFAGVWKIVVGALTFLFTSLLGVLVWLFKYVVGKFNEYHAERKEEKKETVNKFDAINLYMTETDKIQAIHQNRIEGIHETLGEVKKQQVIDGKVLERHDVEIKNLK